MDTLCGIGLPELVILALLGFVVIGPERSREVALQLGRWLRTLMRSPWWREFNQITDSLRNLPTTLVRMAELEEAQEELQQTLSDIERDTKVDMPDITTRRQSAPQAAEEPENPWGIESSPPTEPAEPAYTALDEDDTPPTTPPEDAPDVDASPPDDETDNEGSPA